MIITMARTDEKKKIHADTHITDASLSYLFNEKRLKSV